ncbi:MAG: NlpC/P60 family protein [Pseudomonadota bacterium]
MADKTPQTQVADTLDRRLTPVREDLVSKDFQDRFPGITTAPGEPMMCAAGVTGLMKAPSLTTGRETELLFGEPFTVYEHRGGWAWGQSGLDGYVGYVAGGDLAPFERAPTHRVSVLRTLIFSEPDIKSAPHGFVSMNSLLRGIDPDHRSSRFFEITLPGQKRGHVIADHCAPTHEQTPDYVALAEYYLDAPYLWGGRSSLGLDCSALVQNALTCACGIAPGDPPILRDTDMQEKTIGKALEGAPLDLLTEGLLKRGDVIFWKGHVALMRDDRHIVHANATHMCVSIDPLKDYADRVSRDAGPVTSIRRLAARS